MTVTTEHIVDVGSTQAQEINPIGTAASAAGSPAQLDKETAVTPITSRDVDVTRRDTLDRTHAADNAPLGGTPATQTNLPDLDRHAANRTAATTTVSSGAQLPKNTHAAKRDLGTDSPARNEEQLRQPHQPPGTDVDPGSARFAAAALAKPRVSGDVPGAQVARQPKAVPTTRPAEDTQLLVQGVQTVIAGGEHDEGKADGDKAVAQTQQHAEIGGEQVLVREVQGADVIERAETTPLAAATVYTAAAEVTTAQELINAAGTKDRNGRAAQAAEAQTTAVDADVHAATAGGPPGVTGGREVLQGGDDDRFRIDCGTPEPGQRVDSPVAVVIIETPESFVLEDRSDSEGHLAHSSQLRLFGGHIDSGEDSAHAAERELREKIDLQAESLTHLWSGDYHRIHDSAGQQVTRDVSLYQTEIPSVDGLTMSDGGNIVTIPKTFDAVYASERSLTDFAYQALMERLRTQAVRELRENNQPVEYGQIIEADTRVIFLGEFHTLHEVSDHIVQQAEALRRAGVTHYAIEADSVGNAVLEVLNNIDDPDPVERLRKIEEFDLSGIDVGQINNLAMPLEEARAYRLKNERAIKAMAAEGIKVVAVDKRGQDSEVREGLMTRNLKDILIDTDAVVAYRVGKRHASLEKGPKGKGYVRKRLEADGIKTATVMFVGGARKIFVGGAASILIPEPQIIERYIHDAGLSDTEFAIDWRPNVPTNRDTLESLMETLELNNADFIINLPARSDLTDPLEVQSLVDVYADDNDIPPFLRRILHAEAGVEISPDRIILPSELVHNRRSINRDIRDGKLVQVTNVEGDVVAWLVRYEQTEEDRARAKVTYLPTDIMPKIREIKRTLEEQPVYIVRNGLQFKLEGIDPIVDAEGNELPYTEAILSALQQRTGPILEGVKEKPVLVRVHGDPSGWIVPLDEGEPIPEDAKTAQTTMLAQNAADVMRRVRRPGSVVYILRKTQGPIAKLVHFDKEALPLREKSMSDLESHAGAILEDVKVNGSMDITLSGRRKYRLSLVKEDQPNEYTSRSIDDYHTYPLRVVGEAVNDQKPTLLKRRMKEPLFWVIPIVKRTDSDNATDTPTVTVGESVPLDTGGNKYMLTANNGRVLELTIEENKYGMRVAARSRIPQTTEKQKIPGTTTALYRTARELLERRAADLGLPIRYQFGTSNKNLIRWALDPEKGGSVFQWDEIPIMSMSKADLEGVLQNQEMTISLTTTIQPRSSHETEKSEQPGEIIKAEVVSASALGGARALERSVADRIVNEYTGNSFITSDDIIRALTEPNPREYLKQAVKDSDLRPAFPEELSELIPFTRILWAKHGLGRWTNEVDLHSKPLVEEYRRRHTDLTDRQEKTLLNLARILHWYGLDISLPETSIQELFTKAAPILLEDLSYFEGQKIHKQDMTVMRFSPQYVEQLLEDYSNNPLFSRNDILHSIQCQDPRGRLESCEEYIVASQAEPRTNSSLPLYAIKLAFIDYKDPIATIALMKDAYAKAYRRYKRGPFTSRYTIRHFSNLSKRSR